MGESTSWADKPEDAFLRESSPVALIPKKEKAKFGLQNNAKTAGSMSSITFKPPISNNRYDRSTGMTRETNQLSTGRARAPATESLQSISAATIKKV
jgi:hypothetical protein